MERGHVPDICYFATVLVRQAEHVQLTIGVTL